jgi:hypothetical protein
MPFHAADLARMRAICVFANGRPARDTSPRAPSSTTMARCERPAARSSATTPMIACSAVTMIAHCALIAVSTVGCGGSANGRDASAAPIFVKGVLANKLVAAPGGALCTWTTDPNQPMLTSGVLDVAISDQYEAMFLIGSRNQDAGVAVGRAQVRVSDANGAQLASYSRLLMGGESVQPYALAVTTIIDPNTISSNGAIQALMPAAHLWPSAPSVRLVSHVVFWGGPISGPVGGSDEFSFPVDICNGCLIAFSNDPPFRLRTAWDGRTARREAPRLRASSAKISHSTAAFAWTFPFAAASFPMRALTSSSVSSTDLRRAAPGRSSRRTQASCRS